MGLFKKRKKETVFDSDMDHQMIDLFVVNTEKCVGCGECAMACPIGAIDCDKGYAEIDSSCIVCGACADACPCDAIIDQRELAEAKILGKR